MGKLELGDSLEARLARLPRPRHLVFDFDGTLAPLVRDPRRARLPSRTRRVLAELARQPGFHIGILSARPVAELARKVRLPGVTLVGLYGLEQRLAGRKPIRLPLVWSRRRWARLRDELERATVGTGALVEWKPPTISVHFRGLPPERARAVTRATEQIAGGVPGVEVRPGSLVLELVPRGMPDKGHALERLRMLCGREGGVAYFGDSAADEPAFRAVRAARGLSVRVAKDRRATAAVERLEGPAALTCALEGLLARVRRPRRPTAA